MKQIVSVKVVKINEVAESIWAVLSHFASFPGLTKYFYDDTICPLQKGMVK